MIRSTTSSSLLLCVVCIATGAGLLTACADTAEPVLATRLQAIVNGTRAPSVTNLSPGEEMAIGYIANASGSPFCTATLIDRDVAVTAQHCVEGTYAIDEMKFGMGDPNNPDALIQVHSAPYHGDNDIALLFLSEDAVNRVPSAEPIPFMRATPSSSLVGTTVEAAGYGDTLGSEDGKFYVTVELTEIQDDWLVVNGHGQRGICFGDSGGPLFIHVDNGEPVIAGVESHGDSSCVDQDFETRLDQNADWIDTQMGQFDPNSAPQTGSQGGSDDLCIPLPGFEEGLEAGVVDLKCGEGEFALCSASPVRSNGLLWLSVFPAAVLLFRRRGRR